jgi:hypothetical protein
MKKETPKKFVPALRNRAKNVWGSISVTNVENSFESSYILPVSYTGTAVGAYSIKRTE